MGQQKNDKSMQSYIEQYASGKITFKDFSWKTKEDWYGDVLDQLCLYGLDAPVVENSEITGVIKQDIDDFKNHIYESKGKDSKPGKGLRKKFLGLKIYINDFASDAATSVGHPWATNISEWSIWGGYQDPGISPITTQAYYKYIDLLRSNDSWEAKQPKEKWKLSAYETFETVISKSTDEIYLLCLDSNIEDVKGMVEMEKHVTCVTIDEILKKYENTN